MKSKKLKNDKKALYIFFSILIIITLNNLINTKSFLEAAKEKVNLDEEEEYKYDSEQYRNEPASLNHLYYTKRGQEELAQCRNQFQANFSHCRKYKTCNFCSANSGCGWCDEKKICIPLDLNSQKDELVPLCMGDCIKILKIEFCFKALFEPDNTQDEINFANYQQVNHQEQYTNSPYEAVDLNNYQDSSFENIMEKTLEKNLIESQKAKKEFNYNLMQKSENMLLNNQINNSDSNRNVNNDNSNNNNKIDNFNNFLEKSLNLIQKNSSEAESHTENLASESLEAKLNSEFNSNSFSKSEFNTEKLNNDKGLLINNLKPDCDEANNGVHGVQSIVPFPNDPSLNFIPKSYTNYPNNIDLKKHSQKLYKEMAEISKDVFNSLLSKELKSRKKTNFIKANLDNGPQSEDELLKYLKEFIPNFEFPQFIKSDLEQSINDIKREKLLLWLRGFSLNDPISKIHLPIYQNLSFTNEDQIRKLFLDKFYKDIVKDKNANVDSVMYKNMLGNYGKINFPKNDLSKYIGQKPADIIKDLKVVDSKFIDKKDLIGLVKQSNMRFKEKVNVNSEKDKKEYLSENKLNNEQKGKTKGKDQITNNKKKSLKNITNELKDFMKEIK